MPTVYIAGKITGTDDYVERFARAERELSDKGYTVINPVTIPGNDIKPYDEVMEVCKSHVAKADLLYMLDGWAWSKGAIEELKHFLATHNRDEYAVYYEIQGGMPDAISL